MQFSKLSVDEYMSRVASLVRASLSNSAISAATAKFGFNEARLKKGEKLLAAVSEASEKQEDVIQQKVMAHRQRKKLHAALRKSYMKHLQIARIAFDKDAISSKALQLTGPRAVNLDAWIDQVALFANRLLAKEEWLAKLSEFGISKRDIQCLIKDTEELKMVSLNCERLKTQSKKETSLKKVKLKELQRWVSDYLKIAKIALEEQPGLYSELVQQD